MFTTMLVLLAQNYAFNGVELSFPWAIVDDIHYRQNITTYWGYRWLINYGSTKFPFIQIIVYEEWTETTDIPNEIWTETTDITY